MHEASEKRPSACFCFVIINYKAPEDTISCADSILKNSYKNLSIVIVDNGSSDGSAEKISVWAEKQTGYYEEDAATESKNKRIVVLKLDENRGYAAAANTGIKYGFKTGGFDYFWVLNNDIIFPENAVSNMAFFLRGKEKKPAITGTVQLYHDRPEIIQAAAGGFNRFKGAFVNLGEGQKFGCYRPLKIDYIYGASMVINAEFLRKAGLLSEDYFMYYEEIDMSERARAAGFEIALAEKIFLYHKHALSTSKLGSGFRVFYLERNKAVFYRKFYPALLPFLLAFQLKNFIFSKNKREFAQGFIEGLTCKLKNEKILILEFNDHHDETASPLACLLARRFEVSLFVHSQIAGRGLFDGMRVKRAGRGKIGKFISAVGIIARAHMGRFSSVVFNTWGDRYSRFINLFLPGKINRIGVVHNLEIIENNPVKMKYLVLSRFLYEQAVKFLPAADVSYFYPLFYGTGVKRAPQYPEEVRVCVPGKIEFSRRGYLELADLAMVLKGRKIKFVILGNSLKDDGPVFRKKIAANGTEEMFCFFEGFVPYDLFFDEVKKCRMIMPLIHPGLPDFRKYMETKISAAFNFAYSYKKPLFLHEAFSGNPEFAGRAVFYNRQNAPALFADTGELTAKLSIIEKNLMDDHEFSEEGQINRIENFLGCGLKQKNGGGGGIE